MTNNQNVKLIYYIGILIVLGVVMIVAMPVYVHYIKKSSFVDVIEATVPYRLAVESCYNLLKKDPASLSKCNSNTHGIPPNQGASGNVLSVTVEKGVITARGGGSHGIAGETYILTPTINGNGLSWRISGTCLAQGLC